MEKDQFYEALSETVERTNRHDILVITGDFNSKVGNNPEPYHQVMGRHGAGERNTNGEKLCEFCDTNELVITGTIFPHKNIHKLTWVSPDGQTRNQIDHTLVNKKFRSSIRDTRVYRGADIGSDHYLVKTTIKLKLKKAPRREEQRTRYNTRKLDNQEIKRQFCLKLSNRYEVLETNEEETSEEANDVIETMNTNMERAYNETAKEVLGYKKRRTKPWISQEAWEMIDERKEIHLKIEATRSERMKQVYRGTYKEKDKAVKKQIRKDKRKWLDNRAEEAEEAATQHHMKTLYELTKVLSNQKPRQSIAIKDKEGKILTSSEDRRKRWKEHFSEILNRDEPQTPVTAEEEEEIEDIDTNPPTLAEIQNAIKRLKNGKAAGEDLIVAELLKADVSFTSKKIKHILDEVWKQERTPLRWKRGIIVKLPKKGDLKNCKNWRGITLLPVVSKVLGRIVIDRIRNGVDNKLRKEQAGYRTGRGTTDQVFVLRNIIEQCNEWQAPLYINFVDFEKAFDSVHRESLWIIMKSYGIPGKIIGVVKALYNNFECAVMDEGQTTEWFKIKTGVKQGCNMSGFLFLLIIDWIMKRTAGNGENGIRWKFTTKLDDLDFADDIALLSSTKQQIQHKTDRLVENSKQTGLKPNIDKCKILRMNAKNQESITISGEPLKDVDKFEYLGAFVSNAGGGTMDLENRLTKARATFNRLKSIWSSTSISRNTKLRLFKTLVKTVLMYGSETWKMTKGDNRKLDVFQTKCLRRILKVKWEDHIRNEVILERAGMKSMSSEVQRKRWKYIGHILRKEPNHDCVTAVTWAPEGKRKRGRPKTTWRRTVDKERQVAGWTSWNQARAAAADKVTWRLSVEALCATWHEADS